MDVKNEIENQLLAGKITEYILSNKCKLNDDVKKKLITGELQKGLQGISEEMPTFYKYFNSVIDKFLYALVDAIDIQYETKAYYFDEKYDAIKGFIFARELMCIVHDSFKDNTHKFIEIIKNELVTYKEKYLLMWALIYDFIHHNLFYEWKVDPQALMGVANTLNNDDLYVDIETVPPNIRLFHGTTVELWGSIKKDGCLHAAPKSAYFDDIVKMMNIDISTDEIQEVKADIDFRRETYFVYFEQGLDKPLYFASGSDRKTFFGLHVDLKNMDADGVILELKNPQKYKYILNILNEFIVDGEVDINDLKPYFIKRRNGQIISITDEKGVDASEDLLHV